MHIVIIVVLVVYICSKVSGVADINFSCNSRETFCMDDCAALKMKLPYWVPLFFNVRHHFYVH